jgi:hypothetical protein
MRKLRRMSLSRFERDLGVQGRAAFGLTRDGQLAAEATSSPLTHINDSCQLESLPTC